MNGRVYDPVLGRFLSSDPFIDDAGDSQSYNRYSYVNNNPLGYTDPSGYFKLRDLVKIVAVVVISVVTYGAASGWAYAAGTAATATSAGTAATGVLAGSVAAGTISASTAGVLAGAIGGAAAGFTSGFAGSLLNGGSIGDAFKSGAIGSVAGAITGGIAARYQSSWGLQRIAAKSAAGGISSEIQGGNWRTGAAFAFAMEGLAWVNYDARQAQIKDSMKYTDPKTGLKPNATGTSNNFWRDKFKLGGGRWREWMSLKEQLEDPSPLGGVQGQDGLVKLGPWRMDYAPGSFGDNLVEAYSGIHDHLNSWFWYDINGNALNRTGFLKILGEALNIANVPVATPFAAGAAYANYSYINPIPAATGRRDD